MLKYMLKITETMCGTTIVDKDDKLKERENYNRDNDTKE